VNPRSPGRSISRGRFEKSRRLRRRAEYQQVFDNGQRGRGRFLTVIVAARPAGETRLGIVASKKLGNAVRRNRAKRLIREIFRHSDQPADSSGLDIIVIPRVELFDAAYTVLEQDYRAALARCTRAVVKHVRS
jgi:ribonuclease P protein component